MRLSQRVRVGKEPQLNWELREKVDLLKPQGAMSSPGGELDYKTYKRQ